MLNSDTEESLSDDLFTQSNKRIPQIADVGRINDHKYLESPLRPCDFDFSRLQLRKLRYNDYEEEIGDDFSSEGLLQIPLEDLLFYSDSEESVVDEATFKLDYSAEQKVTNPTYKLLKKMLVPYTNDHITVAVPKPKQELNSIHEDDEQISYSTNQNSSFCKSQQKMNKVSQIMAASTSRDIAQCPTYCEGLIEVYKPCSISVIKPDSRIKRIDVTRSYKKTCQSSKDIEIILIE